MMIFKISFHSVFMRFLAVFDLENYSRGGENRTPLIHSIFRLFSSLTPFSSDYFDYFVIILKVNCPCNLFHLSLIVFVAIIIIFTRCLNVCMPHHFTYNRIINIIIAQCSSISSADFMR